MQLDTGRLVIRDWQLSDAEDAFCIYGDPEVMRYVGTGHVYESVDKARFATKRIMDRYANKPLGFWAVEDKATGEVVGGALLKFLPDHSDIELGYHFCKKDWGKGYGTEIAKALVEYGFGHLGLEKIVAVTYPENAASQRVLEKAGFIHVGQTTYIDIPCELFVLESSGWAPAGDR